MVSYLCDIMILSEFYNRLYSIEVCADQVWGRKIEA